MSSDVYIDIDFDSDSGRMHDIMRIGHLAPLVYFEWNFLDWLRFLSLSCPKIDEHLIKIVRQAGDCFQASLASAKQDGCEDCDWDDSPDGESLAEFLEEYHGRTWSVRVD